MWPPFFTDQVFMKEAERQMLQDTLHKEVIKKIVLLQSWLRMVLERRHFLRMRQAAITLQVCFTWFSCELQFTTKNTYAAASDQWNLASRLVGVPTILGGHWRGLMLPFTFSQHGEDTGWENPTISRGRESPLCRLLSGGTYSVRGKGKGLIWFSQA